MTPLSVLAVVVAFAAMSEAMTFAIIGDWGTGGRKYNAQDEMRSTMTLVDACQKIKCNFTISCGDNIYTPNVVEGIMSSFATDMNDIPGPLFASVGNHDNWGAQVAYKDRNPRWKFLDRHFSVKLPIDETGYTVELFSVDTTDGSLAGGGQYEQLEARLKASDARWKLIFGHYPTTGSGRHRRMGSVSRIHSLMDKYNAQAYFAGHDHIVDVSNIAGRALPLSGGMARGGMMWRGLGSSFRRFTLTHPGEESATPQDWPTHGFMTADISPNVMTVAVWDFAGGVAYEFSTTWDWLSKVHSIDADKRNMWPPASEVHAAFRAEMKLPVGPGGGKYFAPFGGESGDSKKNGAVETPPPAPITTPAPAVGTTPAPAAAPTAAPKPTELPVRDEAITAPTHAEQSIVVRYGVGSECVPCHHKPTAGIPFTLFIDGETVPAGSQLYLTTAVTGCDVVRDPPLVPGTVIVDVSSNVLRFTATGAGTKAHVCLKTPVMAHFLLAERSDSIVAPNTFVLHPPLNMTLPDGTELDLREIPKGHEHDYGDDNNPIDPDHGSSEGDHQATEAPDAEASPSLLWSLVPLASLCVIIAVFSVRFTNPAAVARWLDDDHFDLKDEDSGNEEGVLNQPHRATTTDMPVRS